jgi:hypothetical protein
MYSFLLNVTIHGPGYRQFISNKDKRFFCPLKLSTAALGSTLLLIQWALKAFSLGIKWPGHSDNYSPPFTAPLPHTPS